jgi:hypothetical protein
MVGDAPGKGILKGTENLKIAWVRIAIRSERKVKRLYKGCP